jgi:hypothetical protein
MQRVDGGDKLVVACRFRKPPSDDPVEAAD